MNKFWLEVLRMSPLIGIAGYVLIPDESRGVILFGVAIILLAVALAHGIRKLLFPYLDIKKMADKADESPISSAMVIMALIYLVSVIIQSLVALLR